MSGRDVLRLVHERDLHRDRCLGAVDARADFRHLRAVRRSGKASSTVSAGVPMASFATCDSERSASTCRESKSAREAMPPLPAFPALVNPNTISPMSVSFW